MIKKCNMKNLFTIIISVPTVYYRHSLAKNMNWP